jgi:trigger factor
MNVVCENIDALNAVLKVEVAAADYQEKYDKTLIDYRKKANVPGFRAGKTPMSFIKKQYGKAVLADELNRLVNDQVYKYVTENNLQILGSPIPKEDAELIGNWDNPSDFVFTYEIGYAPSFDVELSSKDSFEYMKVKIDDKIIDEEVDNLRRRYGRLVPTESITGNEIVSVNVIELDENNKEIEGGINKNSSFSVEIVSDEETLKTLKAAVVGDLLNLDLTKLTKDSKDLAAMLGLEIADLEGRSTVFQVEILEIRKMELAEMDEDFFEKVYGPDTVTSEEEMRDKIKADLENIFRRNEEVVFMNKVYDHLMETINPEFPVAFLKRWLKMSSEKDFSDEQWDAEMNNYIKSLKYRLIQNRLFQANNVEITYDDVANHAKALLLENYSRYGIPADSIPEDEVMKSVMNILKDEEQRNEIQSQVTELKFQQIIFSLVSKKEKEVSYEEFVELSKG